MQNFYFHFRVGDRLIADEEGEDLPSLLVAQREAMRTDRELLAEAIKSGRPEIPDVVVIADETGRELCTIPLAMVLPEPLKH